MFISASEHLTQQSCDGLKGLVKSWADRLAFHSMAAYAGII